MMLGPFCLAVLCVTESALLAWLWLARGPQRDELHALKARLCQLEEQMHDLRNQVNPLALWVAQQRVRERREG